MTNVVNFENAFKDHKFDGSHRLQTDFDANGHLFKNLAGFGGSAGKAVRIVSTYAELKAACEDANVHTVLCLPGTYSGSTQIARTAHTYIIGIGTVIIDWTGVVDGALFASGVSYCSVENISFKGTNRVQVYLSSQGLISNCRVSGTDYYVIWHANGNLCRMDNVVGGMLYLAYDNHVFSNCFFSLVLICEACDKVHFSNCSICTGDPYGALYIYHKSTSSTDRDITWRGGEINGGGTVNYCVGISHSDTTAGTPLKNLKFSCVTFMPQATVDPCILLEDDARLDVEDLELIGCTFRDGATGIEVPTNTTLTKPRFVTNVYDNMTAEQTFTGTVTNPIFVMDG